MRLNDSQVSYKTIITHIHWKSIAQEKTETNGLQKHLGKLEENLRLFHSGLMHANDEACAHARNKTRGNPLDRIPEVTSSLQYHCII